MRRLLQPDSDDEDQLMEHAMFMQDIRQYNDLLAFASVHTELSIMDYPRNRQFCYRIHGQMYFRCPPLQNLNNDRLETSQFYILDNDEATEQREGAWTHGGFLVGNRSVNRGVNKILILFKNKNIINLNFFQDSNTVRRHDKQ